MLDNTTYRTFLSSQKILFDSATTCGQYLNFVGSFMHSIDMLNTYHVPDPILSTEDTVVDKTDKISALPGLTL